MWIRLLEIVKKIGVQSSQDHRKNSHLLSQIDLKFFINFLSKEKIHGSVPRIRKTHIIPRGCCLGNPYLSPVQDESINLRKCSPTIK